MSGSARLRNRRLFQAGDIVMHQGEPGSCAYIIEAGAVEIFLEQRGDISVVATRGPGEIFGEMALIDPGPRSASARATRPTTVTILSADALDTLLARAPSGVAGLMRLLIRRLREATTQIAVRDRQIQELEAQLRGRGPQGTP